MSYSRLARYCGFGFAGGCGQRIESGQHAAFLVRDAGEAQAHFDAAKRACQCQVIERAEMADAEYLSGKLGEAGTKGHIEVLEDHGAQLVRIVALRSKNGGERAGIFT